MPQRRRPMQFGKPKPHYTVSQDKVTFHGPDGKTIERPILSSEGKQYVRAPGGATFKLEGGSLVGFHPPAIDAKIPIAQPQGPPNAPGKTAHIQVKGSRTIVIGNKEVPIVNVTDKRKRRHDLKIIRNLAEAHAKRTGRPRRPEVIDAEFNVLSDMLTEAQIDEDHGSISRLKDRVLNLQEEMDVSEKFWKEAHERVKRRSFHGAASNISAKPKRKERQPSKSSAKARINFTAENTTVHEKHVEFRYPSGEIVKMPIFVEGGSRLVESPDKKRMYAIAGTQLFPVRRNLPGK